MERDGAEPLILTLALDGTTFARLDGERRALFPPHLNRIPAHVTLFHHLPGERPGEILAALRAAGAGQGPEPVRVTELMPLGRGVAYRLEAPGVAALRAGLVRLWEADLTPQDRQPWRPHVTVQNKVTPEEARATLARLRARFAPWDAMAEGLRLWRYKGGPWEALAEIPFTGPAGPRP
ncbi:2'-5' RNA ligase family protein [Rubellimicrobium roseum]|uniref:2'-5' RNA ligase family protein n=1 Tax=Rubellimicrobium roseum TaxID=687525 RepID=A0A5C4N6Q9_9RHOB|nr:2'-5' RNA ligase family protein [Rubellimicrobium roseum]TNC62282.1 2'-5' RNA ligase family protein [Rubellimicrobium roseum]